MVVSIGPVIDPVIHKDTNRMGQSINLAAQRLAIIEVVEVNMLSLVARSQHFLDHV